MDSDWNNSKIPRFVKDTVDRKKLFVKYQLQIFLKLSLILIIF